MSTIENHPGLHPHAHHGRLMTILGVLMVVLAGLAVAGLVIRKHFVLKHETAARSHQADLGPHVLVSKAEISPALRDLTLPAEARGYFQTTAYAKVSGYVRDVRVDKGDHVKRGQILGTIESPETDAAVQAARSDVALRTQLHTRAKILAPNVMSAQDLETASSNLKVSNSNLGSALALQSYETIRAPFDGVVTMRYVDPGALMPAATGSTSSAQPFVDIADATRLRIDAYVGQDSARFIHVGSAVTISQDDPTKAVQATVTRTSEALDPRTRTMLCEIELDNTKAKFIPGTFSQVTFHVDAPALPVIPAEALILRDGQELVAVVTNDHVHLVNVTTGVTDGRTMQVVSGLRGGEMVALTLPAEVKEGDAVQATEKPPAPAPGEGAPVKGDGGAPDAGPRASP